MFTNLVKVALLLVIVVITGEVMCRPEVQIYINTNPSPSPPDEEVGFFCNYLNLFCPSQNIVHGPGPDAGGLDYREARSATAARASAELEQQRTDALIYANAKRAAHGASPLKVDPKLQQASQAYAEELAASGTFQHSAANGAYGENLAMMSYPGTIFKANEMWYQEKSSYCPSASGMNGSNGHFTQMVWKGTTHVGYGSAVGKDGFTYIVARYTPAGNYIGEDRTNVQCQLNF